MADHLNLVTKFSLSLQHILALYPVFGRCNVYDAGPSAELSFSDLNTSDLSIHSCATTLSKNVCICLFGGVNCPCLVFTFNLPPKLSVGLESDTGTTQTMLTFFSLLILMYHILLKMWVTFFSVL